MNRKDFEKWIPCENLAKMYHLEKIAYCDGLQIELLSDKHFASENCIDKVTFQFEHYFSFFDVSESYAEGFWITSKEDAWTFFRSEKSAHIDYLKSTSVQFSNTVKRPLHFVLITVNSVLHIISDTEPKVLIQE